MICGKRTHSRFEKDFAMLIINSGGLMTILSADVLTEPKSGAFGIESNLNAGIPIKTDKILAPVR